jgi:hypothetical protein
MKKYLYSSNVNEVHNLKVNSTPHSPEASAPSINTYITLCLPKIAATHLNSPKAHSKYTLTVNKIKNIASSKYTKELSEKYLDISKDRTSLLMVNK